VLRGAWRISCRGCCCRCMGEPCTFICALVRVKCTLVRVNCTSTTPKAQAFLGVLLPAAICNSSFELQLINALYMHVIQERAFVCLCTFPLNALT
jgi:hypothetical protein